MGTSIGSIFEYFPPILLKKIYLLTISFYSTYLTFPTEWSKKKLKK